MKIGIIDCGGANLSSIAYSINRLGYEPVITNNQNKLQIFDTIKRINKENKTTILLVEQNAFGALKLSDRGYVLVNGKVTISGNSKELLENPEIKKAYLEGA